MTATPKKNQGEQPKDPNIGGANTMLWPTFWAWLRKTRKPLKTWEAIQPQDREGYFIDLVLLVVFVRNPAEQRRWLARCNATAPYLTTRALPVLRRRLKELTAEVRGEVNSPKGRDFDGKTLDKITPRQAQIRKRQRDAADSFRTETYSGEVNSIKPDYDHGLGEWISSKPK